MCHEPACELLPQKVQLGDAAAAAAVVELQPLLVAELQLVEQRPVEQLVEQRLVEQRPVEQRPVEQRLVEQLEQRPPAAVEQRRLVELLGRLPAAVELQLAGRAVQRPQQRAGPGKHAELAQQKVEPGKQADLAAAAAAGGLPQLQQRRAGLAGTGYDYVELANEVQGRP